MIPERYAPMTYALFRIVFGFVFLTYGLQKLFGWFGGVNNGGGAAAALMSMQGAAGVIEAVCGLLIMIGLLTKLAAFLASGEMAVAFWYIHVSVLAMGDKGAGLPMGLFPIMNGGERATLFCFAFLYIATQGAGIWSVDTAMGQTKART
jgi:putative oxidoreductase